MKVLLVAVGKVRGNLSDAVADFEARAGRYWKLEVFEVAAGGAGRSAGPEEVMAAEATRILSKIPAQFEIVALTREGRGMESRELSAYLEGHAVRSSPGVAFVIGGAFGLHTTVRARARRTMSLSTMTFPHEMARLFLAEQLYRAGTILRGEPYHKG
jgi:23S rRNA (pseudouridine1915-N3)-methyltransferase